MGRRKKRLYESNTYSGKYGRVFLHNREFLGKYIKAGESYSTSYYPKKTKFFMSQHTSVAGWKGSLPDTSTGTLAPALANKIAMLYPEIINTHSKKTMPLLAKANFPVVSVDKRANGIAERIEVHQNLLNSWWGKY
ncbi:MULTISPECIES: hypothetical protein [Bacillus amyloliquefaciens group]|uniref:hypothetical protein n=1 Tax=Bacillus amyloliquefaciens group TaxID=1938374 RepID=UPI000B5EF595|nr:hypothetical protein [Bacillus velezensis]ASB66587.1 hypothetical protein S101413_03145 [Bacillus velezensis]UBM54035.1 hypothetical protein LAZ97_14740 [Bacillus velezensis]